MGVKGLTKILSVLGTNLTISIYLKSQNMKYGISTHRFIQECWKFFSVLQFKFLMKFFS